MQGSTFQLLQREWLQYNPLSKQGDKFADAIIKRGHIEQRLRCIHTGDWSFYPSLVKELDKRERFVQVTMAKLRRIDGLDLIPLPRSKYHEQN